MADDPTRGIEKALDRISEKLTQILSLSRGVAGTGTSRAGTGNTGAGTSHQGWQPAMFNGAPYSSIGGIARAAGIGTLRGAAADAAPAWAQAGVMAGKAAMSFVPDTMTQVQRAQDSWQLSTQYQGSWGVGMAGAKALRTQFNAALGNNFANPNSAMEVAGAAMQGHFTARQALGQVGSMNMVERAGYFYNQHGMDPGQAMQGIAGLYGGQTSNMFYRMGIPLEGLQSGNPRDVASVINQIAGRMNLKNFSEEDLENDLRSGGAYTILKNLDPATRMVVEQGLRDKHQALKGGKSYKDTTWMTGKDQYGAGEAPSNALGKANRSQNRLEESTMEGAVAGYKGALNTLTAINDTFSSIAEQFEGIANSLQYINSYLGTLNMAKGGALGNAGGSLLGAAAGTAMNYFMGKRLLAQLGGGAAANAGGAAAGGALSRLGGTAATALTGLAANPIISKVLGPVGAAAVSTVTGYKAGQKDKWSWGGFGASVASGAVAGGIIGAPTGVGAPIGAVIGGAAGGALHAGSFLLGQMGIQQDGEGGGPSIRTDTNDGTGGVGSSTAPTAPGAGAPSPGGGTPSTGGGGGGGGNPQRAFNYLIGKGFSRAGAAGIIGNLMQESGVNPKSQQRNGPGRGIMQWTESQRWASLKKWAGSRDPWDLNTQLDYMMHEMDNAGVTGTLKKEDNYREAALFFEKKMERAGTPMMDRRYAYAKTAYDSYARGTMNVPQDQTANIHAGEMIIPERIAKGVRDSLAKQSLGMGGGKVVNLNVYPNSTSYDEAVRLTKMIRDLLEDEDRFARTAST